MKFISLAHYQCRRLICLFLGRSGEVHMNVLQDYLVLFFIQSCVFVIATELYLNKIHGSSGDFSHT